MDSVCISQQEARVLRLVALGHANPQIAQLLGVSEQTIKNHVTALFDKLDVQSRTILVAAALSAGVITLDELFEEAPRARHVEVRNLNSDGRSHVDAARMRRHLEYLLSELEEQERALVESDEQYEAIVGKRERFSTLGSKHDW